MTEREIIEQLKSLRTHCEDFREDEGCVWSKDVEALDWAIEAVEKQIPKKPEITATGNLVKTRCNICGFINSYVDWHTAQYKYCPSCGNAIDWSKEE